jgi:DNA polymerase-3 subunit delta
MTGDLAERIARATALDTRMARSEIEKLALYLDASPQSPRTADAAALDAVGAATEDDGMMPVVNAVLQGSAPHGRRTPPRARTGHQSGGASSGLERRAAQLAQLAGRLGARSDINSFLEQEMAARRVFFRDKPDLANQLKRWRGKRLERLLERLISLHRSLLADSRNADLQLWHALSELRAPRRARFRGQRLTEYSSVDSMLSFEAALGERVGLRDDEWAIIGELLPPERGRVAAPRRTTGCISRA